MSILEILTSLRARWRVASLVFMFVVGGVTLGTLLRTPQYTATASVLLDVKSPDPIAGMVIPGMAVAGYMATQLNVIQSERVALRVIEALKLDQQAERKQAWLDSTNGVGDFKSWISDGLLRKLDVIPSRDSNVISVAYTSSDAVYSAAVANAFVKAYIDTTLELRVEPAKIYNGFFDARSKQLRDQLEQAQAKLSDFQREKGIIATDERLDIESIRLSELSSQLVALQGVAEESRNRQVQSANNSSQMQEIINSPLLLSTANELAKQEARLRELEVRLGNNHPDIVELRAKIEQQRAQLAADTKRVAGSLAVNNGVNAARLAQLRASVEEQRTKLLGLKSQRDEALVLSRDVENAQRSYDLMVTRANQTSIESQTTQTNVSVLKYAFAPADSSSPRIVLNLAVAVFVGCILGLAAALARELRDRRLRTDRDVVRGLGQHLLGVLPGKSTKRRMSLSALRLTTQGTGGRPSR